MRVSISGEAEYVGGLADLPDAPIEIKSIAKTQDDSESRFGLDEINTVIGIVNGLGGLVQVLNLLRLNRQTDKKQVLRLLRLNRQTDKKQVLRLKSSLGEATIELTGDLDAGEIHRALAPLFQE